MIPILLGDMPKEIPKSKVVEREELNYSISMSHTDSSGVKIAKNPKHIKMEDLVDYPGVYIGIRRHLRSNRYSIIIKFLEHDSQYELSYARINGKLYKESELSYLKNPNGFYQIHPDSGLEGWSSDLKDFSSIVLIATNNITESKTLRFSFNLKSHKNTENKKVNMNKNPIDLESVNNSNFFFFYKPNTGEFVEEHWNMYNHLILKPLPIKNRVIKDIYEIYSYNDSIDPEKRKPVQGTPIDNFKYMLMQRYFNQHSEDESLERDFDFHQGKIGGLKANKKTEMETWINVDKKSKYNLGKMSIKNYSYYNFKQKKTIIEPNKRSVKGYIFPLNEKGELKTHLSFSPNAAYKKLEVYRQYNIEDKVLDMYEGLVSLKITNPKKTSLPIKKTMIFNKESFKKIILNDLSLKSLERISDE
ncbi:MHO_1580 family protein [Mycoplasma todarodis]|uniref:MHO_1580 family protein n=1 Tax=Mycoplasma todarodis TaxID=1937191 RepID=UPI003B3524D0